METAMQIIRTTDYDDMFARIAAWYAIPLYRVVWQHKQTGAQGHGGWLPSVYSVTRLAEQNAQLHPESTHWIEELYWPD
jgi:hypothetical protein